jgi:hypothetical protein
MAKSFSGGLSSLLQSTKDEPEKQEPSKPKVKRGRPTTSTREITKSSQEGTREGETRATFIVKESSLETFKALAFWERKELKKAMQEAMEAYINTRTPSQIKQAEKAYQESKEQ